MAITLLFNLATEYYTIREHFNTNSNYNQYHCKYIFIQRNWWSLTRVVLRVQRDVSAAVRRVSSSEAVDGRRPQRRGQRGGAAQREPSAALARRSPLYTHDRTIDARARCRITALNISRERDRLFGNVRAPCFDPVIDSAE